MATAPDIWLPMENVERSIGNESKRMKCPIFVPKEPDEPAELKNYHCNP